MDANATVHETDWLKGGPAAADRDAYIRDGVIVVRNFLPSTTFKHVTDDLRARVDVLERHHGAVAPPPADGTGDLEALSRRVVALEEQVPGTHSILYDAMSRAPAIHAAAAQAEIMALTGNFVAPPVAHHDRFILLMSLPETTWHLAGWHQDWYYNEGPAETLTFYAPLQRTDETNGMLQFALGEHRNGSLAHGDFDSAFPTKWHTIDPAAVERFERVAAPALDPGDVVLFDSLVPHSARVNMSGSIRFVLNFRYHGLDDAAFVETGWRIGKIDHARRALSRAPKLREAI